MTKRVLICTLPLQNGNYGGLLQAYALQQALRGQGFEPVTDNSPRFYRRGRMFRLKEVARRLLLVLGVSRASWIDKVVEAANAVRISEFADRRISCCSLYTSPGCVDSGVVAHADAFVVGSDQVWRAKYADPREYLFSFLPDKDPRPRISYAASFGRDDLQEYTKEMVYRTAELAKRLDAISVREISAVELCREGWGLEAEQHMDPTFLLSKSDYQRLAAEADDRIFGGRVVDYFLDESREARELAKVVARIRNRERFSLIPPRPGSYLAFIRHPAAFRRPSVEAWVGTIGAADFVVTDSFHGTVFAIIQGVPFITVANRSRGVSRVSDLLTSLGLEERLVELGSPISKLVIQRPIDWQSVHERIADERSRSLNFLVRELS